MQFLQGEVDELGHKAHNNPQERSISTHVGQHVGTRKASSAAVEGAAVEGTGVRLTSAERKAGGGSNRRELSVSGKENGSSVRPAVADQVFRLLEAQKFAEAVEALEKMGVVFTTHHLTHILDRLPPVSIFFEWQRDVFLHVCLGLFSVLLLLQAFRH